MKDFIRLIGQRKGFYLTMLILSLLITIIGTNFHINISFKDGRNLVANLNNFVNQYSIVGFGFLTVLVFLLVFLNKFQMNDQKTKEFLETLPVKRITLELFDYVALSTMLILDGVVSMLLYMQYLFAFISSMDFGMLMFLGMGCSFKPLPGILMIIGMIALFCLMIYYFTPGRENAFKFRKKSK